MAGRTPGIVVSVDRERREVRVQIPGQTDGAGEYPIAEIEYPIGDKSEHTEIRILEGDRVWLDFINDDPRYPIITGFRARQADNEVGTRRWHHDNFSSEADTLYEVEAGERIHLKVGANQVIIENGVIRVSGSEQIILEAPQTTCTGNLSVQGNIDAAGTIMDAGGNSNHHSH